MRLARLLAGASLLAACRAGPTPAPLATYLRGEAPTLAPAATHTAAPSDTAVPTDTAEPSATPAPPSAGSLLAHQLAVPILTHTPQPLKFGWTDPAPTTAPSGTPAPTQIEPAPLLNRRHTDIS